MNVDEITSALSNHHKWLTGQDGGHHADLRDADLRGADLRDADLRHADLRDADLRGANLRYADLRDADLRGANLSGANLPPFQIAPEEGAFVAWKAAGGAILKLEIPATAERTSALIGRKCRASEVKVLAAYVDGEAQPEGAQFRSDRGGVYVVGETTKPDSYDPDIRVECSHGIHFFITRAEAEAWR